MQCDTWNVTRNKVGEKFRYSVWRGSEKTAAGYVDSFDEAQALIDQLEQWVEDYERNENAASA